jgi:glutaredoxin
VTTELRLYTRKDCCLCDEMKRTLDRIAARMPFTLEEIDVDASDELGKRYGAEVPVLFVNGRKAFKYRVTAKELRLRLEQERKSGSGPGGRRLFARSD